MKKSLKDKSVLIVDDDERNRYALSAYLDILEVQVLTATDGAAALELLRNGNRVDLILLDIMMPVMDGYEMLRHLKKDDVLKNIPVIAVTARAMKGDDALCIEAGASDYVAKPIDLTNFASTLEKWL